MNFCLVIAATTVASSEHIHATSKVSFFLFFFFLLFDCCCCCAATAAAVEGQERNGYCQQFEAMLKMPTLTRQKKETYPPPPPPPPPPGGGVNCSSPFGALLTTPTKIDARASESLFPEAVATAVNFSVVKSSPPATRHEREATSSSFWPSVSSARLVYTIFKFYYCRSKSTVKPPAIYFGCTVLPYVAPSLQSLLLLLRRNDKARKTRKSNR